MAWILQHLCSPPELPLLDLPLPVRFLPGVKQAVGEICKSMYYFGYMDGFAVGAAITLAIVFGIDRGKWAALALKDGVSHAVNAS